MRVRHKIFLFEGVVIDANYDEDGFSPFNSTVAYVRWEIDYNGEKFELPFYEPSPYYELIVLSNGIERAVLILNEK